MESSKFKVFIVSGSLASLTLAHCLEHAGVSYPELEKHRIAPEIGPSLGIMPNGGRIFDQLEKYTNIEALTAPIQAIRFAFNDGYSVLDRIVSTFNARRGSLKELSSLLEIFKTQAWISTHVPRTPSDPCSTLC
ncbi:hypothetical protein ETB97_001222 [Aspergillus alliaceus]|uniref:FAD-binding domain-containing protein n=1 Tax=Petromyces alliaceus TaxID=209559 RepID=A0A8H6E797_PETAA|nr:hypothetical protein ETB97_001222 [Aspergillus burnettii]